MPNRRPKPSAGRQKALTVVQQKRLLAAAQRVGSTCFTAVLWTLETASRATETCHARWNHVDLGNRTVRIHRLKRSKPVVSEISDRLVRALRDMDSEDPSGYIFRGRTRCKTGGDCTGGHLSRRTLYHWVEAAGRSGKLPHGLQHPHMLKHTGLQNFADRLTDQGITMERVLAMLMEFSGHKKYESLLQYLVPAEVHEQVSNALRQFYEDL